MPIQSLKLFGFLGFKEETVFHFDKSKRINIITGKSGKRSLIEAILFILNPLYAKADTNTFENISFEMGGPRAYVEMVIALDGPTATLFDRSHLTIKRFTNPNEIGFVYLNDNDEKVPIEEFHIIAKRFFMCYSSNFDHLSSFGKQFRDIFIDSYEFKLRNESNETIKLRQAFEEYRNVQDKIVEDGKMHEELKYLQYVKMHYEIEAAKNADGILKQSIQNNESNLFTLIEKEDFLEFQWKQKCIKCLEHKLIEKYSDRLRAEVNLIKVLFIDKYYPVNQIAQQVAEILQVAENSEIELNDMDFEVSIITFRIEKNDRFEHNGYQDIMNKQPDLTESMDKYANEQLTLIAIESIRLLDQVKVKNRDNLQSHTAIQELGEIMIKEKNKMRTVQLIIDNLMKQRKEIEEEKRNAESIVDKYDMKNIVEDILKYWNEFEMYAKRRFDVEIKLKEKEMEIQMIFLNLERNLLVSDICRLFPLEILIGIISFYKVLAKQSKDIVNDYQGQVIDFVEFTDENIAMASQAAIQHILPIFIFKTYDKLKVMKKILRTKYKQFGNYSMIAMDQFTPSKEDILPDQKNVYNNLIKSLKPDTNPFVKQLLSDYIIIVSDNLSAPDLAKHFNKSVIQLHSHLTFTAKRQGCLIHTPCKNVNIFAEWKAINNIKKQFDVCLKELFQLKNNFWKHFESMELIKEHFKKLFYLRSQIQTYRKIITISTNDLQINYKYLVQANCAIKRSEDIIKRAIEARQGKSYDDGINATDEEYERLKLVQCEQQTIIRDMLDNMYNEASKIINHKETIDTTTTFNACTKSIDGIMEHIENNQIPELIVSSAEMEKNAITAELQHLKRQIKESKNEKDNLMVELQDTKELIDKGKYVVMMMRNNQFVRLARSFMPLDEVQPRIDLITSELHFPININELNRRKLANRKSLKLIKQSLNISNFIRELEITQIDMLVSELHKLTEQMKNIMQQLINRNDISIKTYICIENLDPIHIGYMQKLDVSVDVIDSIEFCLIQDEILRLDINYQKLLALCFYLAINEIKHGFIVLNHILYEMNMNIDQITAICIYLQNYDGQVFITLPFHLHSEFDWNNFPNIGRVELPDD